MTLPSEKFTVVPENSSFEELLCPIAKIGKRQQAKGKLQLLKCYGVIRKLVDGSLPTQVVQSILGN